MYTLLSRNQNVVESKSWSTLVPIPFKVLSLYQSLELVIGHQSITPSLWHLDVSRRNNLKDSHKFSPQLLIVVNLHHSKNISKTLPGCSMKFLVTVNMVNWVLLQSKVGQCASSDIHVVTANNHFNYTNPARCILDLWRHQMGHILHEVLDQMLNGWILPGTETTGTPNMYKS